MSTTQTSHKLNLVINFSNSDNAILAFWLVHCISVTSHYTSVWPYIEMNAPNVARHKFVCVKPSFVDKKMAGKNRLGELSTVEIQEITENAVPVKTKKSQNSGWDYSTCNLKAAKFQISSKFYAFVKITTTIFTLMLLNGLLVLVAPNFRNR